MSILSGIAINDAITEGTIVIDPFDPKCINPASVDLHLGKEVVTYVRHNLDARKEHEVNTEVIDNMGFLLSPGRLYLMHTEERVFTSKYVPVLDGKSSIGRLGICVHLTAGYGDSFFDGQYTLEVTAVQPVIIYRGMRFCQMRFHELVGEAIDYRAKGNYTGKSSMGAVPSMAYKQFGDV